MSLALSGITVITWSMLLGVGREGGETEKGKWRGRAGGTEGRKAEKEIRREGQRTKIYVDIGRAWFVLD